MKLGILVSHPIQYYTPLYRELASLLELEVFFAHRQTPRGQANAGFGVAFEWDVDLLSGYPHTFLANQAAKPGTDHFLGCDTPEIGREIARRGFDGFVVIGWALKSHWQAIRACQKAGTPVFIRGDSQLGTPRSAIKRLAKRFVHRWIVRQFDGYLVVGERAKEYLLHYGARPERMFRSPHFVDNGWFRSRSASFDRGVVRAQHGIDPAAVVLLFVGKFIPKKRPLDMIAGAAELKRLGIPTECLMVGSGPLAKAIGEAAREQEVVVHCVGFKNQSELPAYYRAADLLVLPSDGGETWGLVVNEAMACGLPAVVSDAVGCGPDLINPGTGAVFPLGKTLALAKVIETLRPRLGSVQMADAVKAKIEQYSPTLAARGVIEALQGSTDREVTSA